MAVSTETASGEGRKTPSPLVLKMDSTWNPKRWPNNANDYTQ
jgi:hypothetical protein